MEQIHPLQPLLSEWLPEVDFAILSHGFARHGRDYRFILQWGGTYELTLTHVVELKFETRVSDKAHLDSWDDLFTDYAAWEAAGGPEGYVWGVNWSNGYPGLDLMLGDPGAQAWTQRLGKPFHAVAIETEQFRIHLIFHNARSTKLSDDNSIVDSVIIPLPPR